MEDNGNGNGRENRAAEDFMGYRHDVAEEEKRRFVNMREALIDVLVELEREERVSFAKKLKRRVVASRSIEELRLIADGMLVLAGFTIRSE